MIVVDARGMRCPWPALRAARALRESPTVEVIADDPAAPRELAALARAHGLHFENIGNGGDRYLLTLAESSTRP